MALTDNLISYYKFDGDSNDSVGSNNGTDTSIPYVSGKIGNCASFNGSSSKIHPPSGSIRPTGNFTVNAWIKTNGLYSVGQQIFATYSQLTPSVSGFRLGLQENTNKVYLISGKNTGYVIDVDYKALVGATTVSTGVWTMVTGVYNGSKLEVFVNGVSDGSVAWTNAPVYQADSKPTIGANNYQQALFVEYFNGSIDELGIYSRALSLNEIRELFDNGNGLAYPLEVTLTNSLVSYYKLEANSNDSVGSNHGVDTSVPYVAGKIGNAGSYNGTSSKTLVSSNLGITNGPCSISLWCKLNAEITTGTYQIIHKQDLGTQVGYLMQYEYNGGTRRMVMGRNKANVGTNTVYYTASLGTSNYFHFCLTYDGTNVEGYVNGSSIGTIASSGNGGATGYTNVLNIGYVSYGGVDQQYANAIIDEVGIYSRAISGSQVTQLYNGGSGQTYPFTPGQLTQAAILLLFAL